MEFDLFLKQAKMEDFWRNKNFFCFQTNKYSPFFFYTFFNYVWKKKLLPVVLKGSITRNISSVSILSLIGQGTLGERNFFWLGDIEKSVTDKNKKNVIKSLLSYLGPNVIAFFVNDDVKVKKSDVIKVKNDITLKDFQQLEVFFDKSVKGKKLFFVKRIFSQIGTISLDFACMLFEYLDLLSDRYVDDFFSYLVSSLKYDESLRHLSGYFFSKNSSRFFKLWSSVYSNYSEMFWIAFWSEQIWRAYYVVLFLQNNDFISARKMGFRLPIAFLKKDWNLVSLSQLSKLHDFLYFIDFSMKKGSTFYSLDLFYCHHFLSKRM
jgi:hypothetical protein